MKIKQGVQMAGLSVRMRPVLIIADRLWKEYGIDEGVTVTSALDGEHRASSLHYYGYALDLRIRYFSDEQRRMIADDLAEKLGFCYDVVLHKSHIHVEYDPKWEQ